MDVALLDVFYYTFEHSLFYCFDYIVPSMICSMIKSVWSALSFFNLDRKLNLQVREVFFYDVIGNSSCVFDLIWLLHNLPIFLLPCA